MRILIWGSGFETVRDVPNHFDDKEIGNIVLNEFGEKAFENAWGWAHTDRPLGTKTWDDSDKVSYGTVSDDDGAY